jgi:hypothetical protein
MKEHGIGVCQVKRVRKKAVQVPGTKPVNITMCEALVEQMHILRDAVHLAEKTDCKLSRLYIEAVTQYLAAPKQQDLLKGFVPPKKSPRAAPPKRQRASAG